MRALLVEDEFLIAMMERRLLEELGMIVVCARNFREAISKFDAEPGIEIAVVDFNLGGGPSGDEVIRTLRERGTGVRCVFVSGNNVEELAGELNCPYVTKPFTLDELRIAIANAKACPAAA